MFIDELKLHIEAGRGGDGVVRFRHEKYREFSGPSGGDGGRGADVFIKAQRDVNLLSKYRNTKEFKGDRGEDGGGNSRHGKDGADLIIDLPLGSIVTNLSTNQKFYLDDEEEVIEILQGGKGGFGNEHFKSSRNTKPKDFTLGKSGEVADFFIELELIADIGFIGLPNAGKTSLLNALTQNNKKVGDYSFTTLEPNLGSLFGSILADIPGLIEDSSEGKGLGFKFLRHIKKSKILLHCVSLESENLTKAYKTIRREIKNYNNDLVKKPEFVVLTKNDLVSDKKLSQLKNLLIKELEQKQVFTVSVKDPASVKILQDQIVKILKNLNL